MPSCAAPGSAWSAQAVWAVPSVQHTSGWSATGIDELPLDRRRLLRFLVCHGLLKTGWATTAATGCYNASMPRQPATGIHPTAKQTPPGTCLLLTCTVANTGGLSVPSLSSCSYASCLLLCISACSSCMAPSSTDTSQPAGGKRHKEWAACRLELACLW